jgi:hypothetical protein
MDPVKKFRSIVSTKWFKLAVRSGVYVALALLLLHEATQSSLLEECTGGEAPAGVLSNSDYTAIVTHSSFREPSNHKVLLVTLTGGIEPDEILTRLCSQRFFTSRLIRRLNELGAAVIALDKQYGVTTCQATPEERKQTDALADAIRASRAVVTRGLPTALVTEENVHGKRVCLRGQSTLELPVPTQNSGVIRLDADTRRTPLVWTVLKPQGTDGEQMETLALVTARAADASALATRRLRKALERGEQPFSTMVHIPQFSAVQILCGRDSSQSTDWRACRSTEAWPEMNGAVLVIGDHNGENDRHATVGGYIYGVDLQANYIAALLDQRYYLPLLTDTQNQATIVIFFLAQLTLYWKCKSRVRAFLYGVLLWALIFLVSIVLLAFTGYLLTVWVQGINLISVLIIFLEHWAAELGESRVTMDANVSLAAGRGAGQATN